MHGLGSPEHAVADDESRRWDEGIAKAREEGRLPSISSIAAVVANFA